MAKKNAQMAMDMAMFFGRQDRVELMEAHAAGEHVNWDMAVAQKSLQKDFPEGCPHANWLKKADVIKVDEEVESSRRTKDLGPAARMGRLM